MTHPTLVHRCHHPPSKRLRHEASGGGPGGARVASPEGKERDHLRPLRKRTAGYPGPEKSETRGVAATLGARICL